MDIAHEKLVGRTFEDLSAGDRETIIAEITQIKIDEKNTPPQWFLYYLFDGTTTIRAFGKKPEGLGVGDIVKVDLSVKEGKPFNNKPQLNYRCHSIDKVDKNDKQFAQNLEKLKYTMFILDPPYHLGDIKQS